MCFGAEDAEGATLYDCVAMITMFDEPAERSRSHGLRPELQTLDLKVVQTFRSAESAGLKACTTPDAAR